MKEKMSEDIAHYNAYKNDKNRKYENCIYDMVLILFFLLCVLTLIVIFMSPENRFAHVFFMSWVTICGGLWIIWFIGLMMGCKVELN